MGRGNGKEGGKGERAPSPVSLRPSHLSLAPRYPYQISALQKQMLLQDAAMGEKLLVYDEVQVECTRPWLEAPQALILPHNGRNFEVQVTLSKVLFGYWAAAYS